jgi:hypothetical protein
MGCHPEHPRVDLTEDTHLRREVRLRDWYHGESVPGQAEAHPSGYLQRFKGICHPVLGDGHGTS